MDEFYEWPDDNTGMFRDTFSLTGRICRLEFFIVFGVGLVISLGLWFTIPILANLFDVLWGIVLLAEGVKRMHDFDVSGKWIIPVVLVSVALSVFRESIPWLAIIGAAVPLVFFIALLLIPGTKGINQYGTNPTRNYHEQTLEAGFPDME